MSIANVAQRLLQERKQRLEKPYNPLSKKQIRAECMETVLLLRESCKVWRMTLNKGDNK